MIAPNLWIDPRNGNNYFLTVQYPEAQIRSVQDLRSIPLHADGARQPTRLDMIANIERIKAPTEVDHYQIRRKLDIYARPATENLGAAADYVRGVIAQRRYPVQRHRGRPGKRGGDERVVQELRDRPDAVRGAACI